MKTGNVPTVSVAPQDTGPAHSFVVVSTGQNKYYNDIGREIPLPRKGEPFYGQDAQYVSIPMQYKDNGDGTVSDLNTGLMWQKTPIADTTWDEAVAKAARFESGGYNDWRLPTIKELYSLISFTGRTGRSASDSIPYIDTKYFNFSYGDTSKGERFIDVQCWSSTEYVSTTMGNDATVFGVNFADGRIKGYPKYDPRNRRQGMRKVVRYVRGNTRYGTNNFRDNGDGTITDSTTGLMWMKIDSGTLKAGLKGDGAMNWQQALAWAENLKYAGYSDWRVPNAKELQSIVDYSRSPATTQSAAIDPIFSTTAIKDAEGKRTYPYFWSSTTHLDGVQPGMRAVYVAFGEAQGYMELPPGSGNKRLLDVHGAGAQRSDPKVGDPAEYAGGFGPQGDVIRIYNFVRCVRGGVLNVK